MSSRLSKAFQNRNVPFVTWIEKAEALEDIRHKLFYGTFSISCSVVS